MEISNGYRFPLEKSERKLVIQEWEQGKDKKEFGQNVFIQIFMYRPAIKRIFGLEEVSVERLPQNGRFLLHAGNFTKHIGLIVESLMEGGDEAAIMRTFGQIGASHHKYTAGIHFDTGYWTLFVDAICDQICLWVAEGKRKKALAAWQKLFTTVVTEMRNNYLRRFEDEDHST